MLIVISIDGEMGAISRGFMTAGLGVGGSYCVTRWHWRGPLLGVGSPKRGIAGNTIGVVSTAYLYVEIKVLNLLSYFLITTHMIHIRSAFPRSLE